MKRHPADKLLSGQWRDLSALLARIRKDLLRVSSTRPDAITATIRDRLLQREPMLAGLIRDGLLGAWLTGGQRASVIVPRLPAGDSPPPIRVAVEAGGDGLPPIRLPLIERAAYDLQRRQILTPAEFAAISTDAKRTAFTVARSVSTQTVDVVRNALLDDVQRGGTLREFRQAVQGAVDHSMAAPHRLEAVYRTHLAQAYSAGQQDVLDHPLVSDEFPYLLYSATHDARTRPGHLQMERLGIQRSAVYRRDDPIWQLFYPPWGWNCRCLVIPLSVEDAARRGIREAQRWLKTGTPPTNPTWVRTPDFRPPPNWPTGTRGIAAVA